MIQTKRNIDKKTFKQININLVAKATFLILI